jgi:hypothetical protein
MKLIDILVEETIENGWSWPEHANCITQDRDREIMPAKCQPSVAKFEASFNRWFLDGSRIDCFTADVLASDYAIAIITREQYEAALAAKNDGWIEWGGGEYPPVSTNAVVDVKLRCGSITARQPAGAMNWQVNAPGDPGDIIAYRLHQPQEAEQAKADDEADLNECIGHSVAPVWNGEGLPPVGYECEVSVDGGRSWCTYRAINEKNGAWLIEIGNLTEEFQNNNWIFRPILSEAERKRDDAVQALCDAGGGNGKVDEKAGYGSCWFDVYDAIAAGKIPGVKLEV